MKRMRVQDGIRAARQCDKAANDGHFDYGKRDLSMFVDHTVMQIREDRVAVFRMIAQDRMWHRRNVVRMVLFSRSRGPR
jgi:hypothetical protein